MPIADHDNNQHSFNENLRFQNLWDGIELWPRWRQCMPGYAHQYSSFGRALWPHGGLT